MPILGLPAACACLAWPSCSWRGLERWWRSGGSGQQHNSSSCGQPPAEAAATSATSAAVAAAAVAEAGCACRACPSQLRAARAGTSTLEVLPAPLTLKHIAPTPACPPLPACCCSGRGILNNPDLRPQSETTTKFADVKGVDEAKVHTCRWVAQAGGRGCCWECLPAACLSAKPGQDGTSLVIHLTTARYTLYCLSALLCTAAG